MQRSIYRQWNWNDASSDFIEKACLHMSITAHHIFFIRYQPKALFFLPNVQFHFAWGLKLKILRNFFIVCFQRKQKEMKASLQYKTKPFFGRGKHPHYFQGSPILILLGERFWDIKDVAHDLSFVKVLFFSHTSPQRFFLERLIFGEWLRSFKSITETFPNKK